MPAAPVADELQHLGREQPHRAGRQPVGPIIVLLILPDRLVIGAEDEGRAVDEKNVVAGADRTVGLGHGLKNRRSEERAPTARRRSGQVTGTWRGQCVSEGGEIQMLLDAPKPFLEFRKEHAMADE